jgi:GNAT superfamily N-acetyltransferase
MTMDTYTISGYEPGAIGRITELHGTYYHKQWGLGLYFEAKVASELAVFLSRFDPTHDGIWIAKVGSTMVGAIVIDGLDAAGEGARLRWFILAEEYQGKGIGSRLMQEAMSFCQKAGFKRVYLTTFAGLDAARHLYEKFSFRVCREEDGSHLTGKSSLVEQVLEIILTP